MAPKVQPNVSLTFLSNLDVFCYLLLNSRTEILKLFVLYHVETKSFGWQRHLCACLPVDHENLSKCARNLAYCIITITCYLEQSKKKYWTASNTQTDSVLTTYLVHSFPKNTFQLIRTDYRWSLDPYISWTVKYQLVRPNQPFFLLLYDRFSFLSDP